MRGDNFFTRFVYRLKADNRYGYGIHSPFVFDFTQQVLGNYSSAPVLGLQQLSEKYEQLLYRIFTYYSQYLFCCYTDKKERSVENYVKKMGFRNILPYENFDNVGLTDKVVLLIFRGTNNIIPNTDIQLKIDCYFFSLYFRNTDIKHYQEYYFWI